MYFSAYIKVVRDKASRTGRLVEIFLYIEQRFFVDQKLLKFPNVSV